MKTIYTNGNQEISDIYIKVQEQIDEVINKMIEEQIKQDLGFLGRLLIRFQKYKFIQKIIGFIYRKYTINIKNEIPSLVYDKNKGIYEYTINRKIILEKK